MLKFKSLMMSILSLLLPLSNNALADGIAKPWQMGFQQAASPLATAAIETHNFVMFFMFAVLFFVLAYVLSYHLLVRNALKFRRKRFNRQVH